MLCVLNPFFPASLSSPLGCSSMILVGTCRWEVKSRPIFIPNFAEKWDPFLYQNQGRIQDFLEEGVPKFKDWQSFDACVDRGCLRGCAPSEKDLSEKDKNGNFQSQFAQFGAFFLPGAPTQNQAPYLCKK